MPKKPTAVQKVKQRALAISPEQVLTFPADERDEILAQGMLNAYGSFQALAEFTEIPKETIRERLLDPVRCAWISQRVDQLIATRTGQVLGAVFTRAISTGDVQAAKMILQQYNKWRGDETQKSVHLNIDAKLDLSHLSDEELQIYVAEQLKKNKKIVDATFEEKPPDDGA